MPEPGGVFNFTLTATTPASSRCRSPISRQPVLPARGYVGEWLDPGQVLTIEYPVTHTEAGTYDNDASITVMDNELNSASASDNQTVTVTDVMPDISVTKTADPTQYPRPAGMSPSPSWSRTTAWKPPRSARCPTRSTARSRVTPTARSAPAWPRVRPANSPSPAWFPRLLGDDHVNVFTGKATDNDGTSTATDDATVTFDDVAPTVTLDKSVDVEFLDEPGGDFTFTLLITNNSAEEVTITALTDSQSGAAVDFSACTALIGTKLAMGASTSCTYVVTHTDVGRRAATTTPPRSRSRQRENPATR